MIKEKIKELLDKRFAEEDMRDCYLVDIKSSGNGQKLEVFVDSDSRLDLKVCTQISRYLEGFIDENGWMGEKYILEVSSPGIGRPLVLKRQYIKNIGRKIEINTRDKKRFKGKLKEVNETDIVVSEELSKKKAKELGTKELDHCINIENIAEAKIKVSFN